ncbi:response regulator [Thermodesulfobacteriota bacterium]
MNEEAQDNKNKILIIEDDKALVAFEKHLLESKGYEVDFSYNGANGIKKVAEFKPDLILLDIMMEVLDGYKVAQHLKGNDDSKFIPIIMVTARSESIDKVKGINCGVDDYLVKPFNTNELMAKVKSLLIKKKSIEQFTEDEKVKTLKDVVASVNHEINNPLTSIIIAVDTLLIKYKDDKYIIDKLKMIEENSIRIKNIVSRLEQVEKIATKVYHDNTNILEIE